MSEIAKPMSRNYSLAPGLVVTRIAHQPHWPHKLHIVLIRTAGRQIKHGYGFLVFSLHGILHASGSPSRAMHSAPNVKSQRRDREEEKAKGGKDEALLDILWTNPPFFPWRLRAGGQMEKKRRLNVSPSHRRKGKLNVSLSRVLLAWVAFLLCGRWDIWTDLISAPRKYTPLLKIMTSLY